MTIGRDVNGQPVTARLNAQKRLTRDVNELLGICRGLVFDDQINQLEAENLLAWLQFNQELLNHWPANMLYERLCDVLSDGVLDSEEAADLVALLKETVGQATALETVNEDTGEIKRAVKSTALPVVEVDVIEFEGCGFVLTGAFVMGTRAECEELIASLGGNCAKNPSAKTHYLVIGEIGSRDWATSSAGRKIEKAIAMREAGHSIQIISEKNLVDVLAG